MDAFSPNVRRRILVALIAVFVSLGIVNIFLPHGLSWDGSVYAGMGKYLFSGGHIGIWETLRPVGFPIILGSFWKLGLDPYLAGQFVALIGAAFVLYFVSVIAERMRQGAGVFAASVLAFTPLFFSYSVIPMTDILSTAFALGSLAYALKAPEKRNLVLVGLLSGIAFLLRFPQGLSLAVSGLVVVWSEWQATGSLRLKELLRTAGWVALGFSLVAVPFLAGNMIAYGDPLLPLKAGSAIIARAPEMYLRSAFFYFTSMYESNSLMLLGLIPAVAFFFKKELRSRMAWRAAVLFLAVYLSYFTHLEHKELRYSLAFLPMAAVFAGVGVSMLVSLLEKRSLKVLVLACVTAYGLYACSGILLYPDRVDHVYGDVAASLAGYEASTGLTPQVLSASPFVVSSGSAKVVATLYDDWREVMPKYQSEKAALTHVLLDTCTLETICPFDGGCLNGKDEALAEIMSESLVVVDGTAGRCHVTLYELAR